MPSGRCGERTRGQSASGRTKQREPLRTASGGTSASSARSSASVGTRRRSRTPPRAPRSAGGSAGGRGSRTTCSRPPLPGLQRRWRGCRPVAASTGALLGTTGARLDPRRGIPPLDRSRLGGSTRVTQNGGDLSRRRRDVRRIKRSNAPSAKRGAALRCRRRGLERASSSLTRMPSSKWSSLPPSVGCLADATASSARRRSRRQRRKCQARDIVHPCAGA